MSKPQHTPGPWEVAFGSWRVGEPAFGFCIRARGKRPSVCGAGIYEPHALMLAWDSPVPHPDAAKFYDAAELEANARLIAAAPELLAALKECSFRLATLVAASGDFSEVNAKALDAASAAITKAEERS